MLYSTNTPQVGLEPTTNRLTADCSTTELLRIIKLVNCNLSHFLPNYKYFETIYDKNYLLKTKNLKTFGSIIKIFEKFTIYFGILEKFN